MWVINGVNIELNVLLTILQHRVSTNLTASVREIVQITPSVSFKARFVGVQMWHRPPTLERVPQNVILDALAIPQIAVVVHRRESTPMSPSLETVRPAPQATVIPPRRHRRRRRPQ